MNVILDYLDDKNLELIKPIHIVVSQESAINVMLDVTSEGEGDYLTEWEETGIVYGGNSLADAVQSMREYIALQFKQLNKAPDAKLGPLMQLRKSILNEHIKECNTLLPPGFIIKE